MGENGEKVWPTNSSSSGSWADAADDNDEVPQSAWGNPIDYDRGHDEAGDHLGKEDFPEVGTQPQRGQRSGFAGRDRRSDQAYERSQDTHQRDRGYEDREGRERGRGSYERERGQGYDDRERGRGYDDRERGRGYDDRERGRGYDDRERGRGYGDRERGRDYEDRERGKGYEERERDDDRGRGRDYDDRERGRGYYERDRDRGYGRGRDRGFGREREEQQVPFPTSPPWTAHVGNLPYEVEKEDLERLFSEHDCKVGQVRLLIDKEGRPRGYGYVEFEDAESLRQALKCHDMDFLGRPLRVNVASERRMSSNRGREGGPASRREGNEDEGKTWRSQRLARAPVSDPLHEDRSTAGDGKAATTEPSTSAKPKPKFNPFGDAKPRDELEVEKKVLELKKQQEEEEKKKRAEERKKKEEEELKKKQLAAKADSQPAVARPQGEQKSSSNWRIEKDTKQGASSGWASKKRTDGPRPGEGRRDPKKGEQPRKVNQPRRPDSAGRGERKPPLREGGAIATGAPRGRSKPLATEAKEKPLSRDDGREEANETRKGGQKEPGQKAHQIAERAPTIQNNNAFALLTEDEEA